MISIFYGKYLLYFYTGLLSLLSVIWIYFTMTSEGLLDLGRGSLGFGLKLRIIQPNIVL